MTNMKSPWTRRLFLAALTMIAVVGIFGCAKPAPEPAGLQTGRHPHPRGHSPDVQRSGQDRALPRRRAGAVHPLGAHSQLGTEISWPLNGASDDYIKRYYALAETFNPTAFDAAAWARLAKLAGIEYVCFTAKHHDGFAMFDTAYSDFKITRSPYGQDIAAAVAEAFRKEGILLGFYYSPGDFRYQFDTGKRFAHLYEPDFTAGAPSVRRKRPFSTTSGARWRSC